jgi:hypothetical protein
MDDNRQDLLVAAFAAWAALLWLATLEQPYVFVSLLGVPFGCGVVFGFVRWLSRRDDPRHVKRPPDDP